MEKVPGYLKGEICDRDGCVGIIDEHFTDSCCSCHINPPCSHCETSREYCPECGWDGREEQLEKYQAAKPTQKQIDAWEEENRKRQESNEIFHKKMRGEILATELEYRSKSHTNSSMIKEGVFPEGMTRGEVEKVVKGTFGGRFEYFGNKTFKYIAYTD